MSSLDSFFASVSLPTIPEVAQQLIRSLHDPQIGMREVSHIIGQDPALTAQLLRLANSAQFGLPRGVGTLAEALQLVGMARVRTLALGACLQRSFPALPGLQPQAFWHNSMACATYAQWLASALEMDSQQAWLTGMMLRLGEILIAQAEPKALLEIERLPQLPGGRWEREKRLVGFSEGQITAELARRWNFPMQIAQALERAYDPLVEQAFSRLGAVIHLAGLLADTPDADARVVDSLPQDVISTLGLDLRWMKATFPHADDFIQLH
jgi:HD-like signal output (HDOD) protein